MVSRYPTAVKAFYMQPDPEDPKVVLGLDMHRARGLRRDHRRQPAHPRPRPAAAAHPASTSCRSRPSSGTSTCASTAPARTPASAWASSASSPGCAGSTTCARPFPTRACSTRSTPDPRRPAAPRPAGRGGGRVRLGVRGRSGEQLHRRKGRAGVATAGRMLVSAACGALPKTEPGSGVRFTVEPTSAVAGCGARPGRDAEARWLPGGHQRRKGPPAPGQPPLNWELFPLPRPRCLA